MFSVFGWARYFIFQWGTIFPSSWVISVFRSVGVLGMVSVVVFAGFIAFAFQVDGGVGVERCLLGVVLLFLKFAVVCSYSQRRRVGEAVFLTSSVVRCRPSDTFGLLGAVGRASLSISRGTGCTLLLTRTRSGTNRRLVGSSLVLVTVGRCSRLSGSGGGTGTCFCLKQFCRGGGSCTGTVGSCLVTRGTASSRSALLALVCSGLNAYCGGRSFCSGTLRMCGSTCCVCGRCGDGGVLCPLQKVTDVCTVRRRFRGTLGCCRATLAVTSDAGSSA